MKKNYTIMSSLADLLEHPDNTIQRNAMSIYKVLQRLKDAEQGIRSIKY